MNSENLFNQNYSENEQKYIFKLYSILNQFRERAEKSGLTEEDVQKEVWTNRSGLTTTY